MTTVFSVVMIISTGSTLSMVTVTEPIATSRKIDFSPQTRRREQSEIEGLLGLAAIARGAHQHGGAIPNLLEAEFVHRQRLGAEGTRIAHQHHAVIAIATDDKGRAAVGEQQQNRCRAFDLHQLTEGEARASRPEAGLAQPFHQHARGGRDFGGIESDRARVGIDAVIAGDVHRPGQARMQRAGALPDGGGVHGGPVDARAVPRALW